MSKALAGFGAGAGVKKATVPAPATPTAGPASESSSSPCQAPDKSSASAPGPANVNKANNVDKGSYKSPAFLDLKSLEFSLQLVLFESNKIHFARSRP